MPEKLDLSKADPIYYGARQQPMLAEFGALPYLALRGQGDPDGPEFAAKTEALYQLAYGIKGMCKAQDNDFVVPKLEGLWWVEGVRDGLQVPRSEWQWRLLIRMPPFVTKAMATAAQDAAAAKKQNALVNEVGFEQITEGKCAQILHIGPYADEPATIAHLHSFIQEQGLQLSGKHHEIYLSDARKIAAERMKTIIRYPVR